MVRSSDFARRSCHCFAAWPAMYVVGVVALALGGCGLDRTGLQSVLAGDGGSNGKGDASVVGGTGGGIVGAGGKIAGTGGESGAGGGIIVDGGGGGSGGMLGTGGKIVGSGGMIVGAGGMIGAGGKIVGSGGTIVGSGGMPGTGGMLVGSGGSTDAGAGGAGMGGSGLGGSPGVGGTLGMGGSGTGGMGTAGAPGVGGMGPPPVCTPACGPCQRCTASHACELDPASRWDLAAISASVSSTNPNARDGTTNWDRPSGEIGDVPPDPFVEFDILTTAVNPVGHTMPIIDTLLPNWGALNPATQALLNPPGAPLVASDLLAGGNHWQIVVYDDDVDADTGPFGETICTIFDPLVAADFLNGGFTRNDVSNCISVSIKLTCHP